MTSVGHNHTRLRWSGPTRMQMLSYFDANHAYDGGAMTFGPYATPRVLYQNRPKANDYDYSASLAGWHYIGVKLDEGSKTDVPITVDVAVIGNEIPAPGYAGEGVRTGVSPKPSADPSRERPAAVSETTTSGPSWWLLTAVGVGGLLVLTIVVVAVRRRARP